MLLKRNVSLTSGDIRTISIVCGIAGIAVIILNLIFLIWRHTKKSRNEHRISRLERIKSHQYSSSSPSYDHKDEQSAAMQHVDLENQTVSRVAQMPSVRAPSPISPVSASSVYSTRASRAMYNYTPYSPVPTNQPVIAAPSALPSPATRTIMGGADNDAESISRGRLSYEGCVIPFSDVLPSYSEVAPPVPRKSSQRVSRPSNVTEQYATELYLGTQRPQEVHVGRHHYSTTS